MEARTYLVTGASTGIALEFVRQVLAGKNKPHRLYATCMDPSNATVCVLFLFFNIGPSSLNFEIRVSNSDMYRQVTLIMGESMILWWIMVKWRRRGGGGGGGGGFPPQWDSNAKLWCFIRW